MWETQRFRWIILLVCLLKLEEIRAQCTRYVGGNREIESEEVSFPDGTVGKVKCVVGYVSVVPDASRSITCNGNQWSEPALQCKKRSCGSPGEVSNGRYLTPNGIEFGAVATLQCNEGYMPSGSQKTRNCRENGWDGRNLECEAVKCTPPPEIDNGDIEPLLEFYSYHDTVTYSCRGKYILDGESDLTCSDDGQFRPSPPACVLVECEPPKINAAIRIGGKSPPYGYKNSVEYKCIEGYKMTGDSRLVCEIRGWDKPFPQCTKTGVDPVPPVPPPSPPPSPDNTIRNVVIGIVVMFVILVSIACGVYCMKKGPGWGKVPTRNDGA